MIKKESLEKYANKFYLTPKECAEIAGVFPTTVIYWLKEKGLKHYKTPGGHYKVKKEDLLEFIQGKNLKKILKHNDKLNILLIEDDTLFANSLKEGLKDKYNIDIAFSYSEGIQKINKNYHVVLLDVNLKDGDGLDLAERIRNNPDTNRIPVIIISGVNKNETIEKGLLLALDFIKKPFSIREIELRLHKLLKNLSYE